MLTMLDFRSPDADALGTPSGASATINIEARTIAFRRIAIDGIMHIRYIIIMHVASAYGEYAAKDGAPFPDQNGFYENNGFGNVPDKFDAGVAKPGQRRKCPWDGVRPWRRKPLRSALSEG
ncbi:MAG: hypothetical protein CVV03_12795 [Firmicutes bacterium HGW-Firmicutes-8]|nr:MAG: hypothetical protein CVV03_12795 [Firmicutes bacterium HGW-Firmicutes-8]